MKHLFDEVSYQCSKGVTSKYSTSFSLSVKMLSPKIQDAIYAIYGFVRLADEIVDSFHDFNREELLDEFEKDLKRALVGRISLNPILNSFQDVVCKYEIPYEHIDAFMLSMRADLHKRTYSNVHEYEEYIYGSADVVGLMCLRVFVGGDQKEFDKLKLAATKLGSAFQKVNFLRDIKEDTELLNRSYFPHLEASHLDQRSKRSIIEEIEKDFKEAYIGIRLLPIEAKFGVYTAYVYYKKLLYKLKRANVEEIKQSRIRISNPTKIGLLARSFFHYKLNLI